MIGIIDYRMGNLRSVQKAIERVGAQNTAILGLPNEVQRVDRLVLPGVGAFADGAQHLREAGWDDAIRSFIRSGKPFLGICLGMQLLFESSQENASDPNRPVRGLGVLPGTIEKFTPGGTCGHRRLKIPHMGWNSIAWSRRDPLLEGLRQGDSVYFVHSYCLRTEAGGKRDEDLVSATAKYGITFCATLWRDNVWATQFHPEKSQRVGQKIIENFVHL